MKKMLWGTALLLFLVVVPVPAKAGISINIGIALPPPIAFQAPPSVIVLPDTSDVYVVPNIGADLFFWNGWWWRLWEGRWYRSHYYNRGWAYYNLVPSFYFDVNPHWRRYYRDRDWLGHRWNYERIPERKLLRNWRSWHNTRHWERQRTWGVYNYRPQSQRRREELRRERQRQYQKRPEVRRHQQEMREQRKYRQEQPQRRSLDERRQREGSRQQRENQSQGKSKHGKSREKHGRGD